LDHQFASHLIRARKPGGEIYVHLEKQTGVSGPEILFFDDMEENVRAAEKRGWNTEWINVELNDPMGQIRKALAAHRVLMPQ
jgi:FMN phosphatase YigB (HAD superfamily)